MKNIILFLFVGLIANPVFAQVKQFKQYFEQEELAIKDIEVTRGDDKLVLTKNGQVYLINEQGAKIYKQIDNTTFSLVYAHKFISGEKENVWVASSNSLISLDNPKLRKYFVDKVSEVDVTDMEVSSGINDDYYWIGSRRNGLFVVPKLGGNSDTSNKELIVFRSITEKVRKEIQEISDIHVTQDVKYIATNQGVITINGAKNDFSHYLNRTRISAIAEYGGFVYASSMKYIWKSRIGTDKWDIIEGVEIDSTIGDIQAMAFDKNGQLYIGGEQLIKYNPHFRFDEVSNKPTQIVIPHFRDSKITSIAVDSKNRIFIGTIDSGVMTWQLPAYDNKFIDIQNVETYNIGNEEKRPTSKARKVEKFKVQLRLTRTFSKQEYKRLKFFIEYRDDRNRIYLNQIYVNETPPRGFTTHKVLVKRFKRKMKKNSQDEIKQGPHFRQGEYRFAIEYDGEVIGEYWSRFY